VSSPQLLVDRVEGTPFHVALDSAEILANEREDEALDAEHEEDGDAAEERPGEVPSIDPVKGAVGAERERKEREKKEAEKHEADKKKQDEQRRVAEARERQTREAAELKAQAEREKTARDAQQKAADADAAARTRAEADYIRRIQAKVKGNVTLPPDLNGNPEAIFEVVQLPTGEIIDTVLRKSSGVRAYDEAVQRAIRKSSPLPRPDRPELFQRTLTLKFRPLD